MGTRIRADFTPDVAIVHAMNIISAAAAAELDARVVLWGQAALSLSLVESLGILRRLRLIRDASPTLDVKVHLDKESMTLQELQQSGVMALKLAAASEMECYLMRFLTEDLGQTQEVANDILHDFRTMQQNEDG